MIRIADVEPPKPVANVVDNAKPAVVDNRRGDRHKDKAARRAYMRDLMRQRRTAAKARRATLRGAFAVVLTGNSLVLHAGATDPRAAARSRWRRDLPP